MIFAVFAQTVSSKVNEFSNFIDEQESEAVLNSRPPNQCCFRHQTQKPSLTKTLTKTKRSH